MAWTRIDDDAHNTDEAWSAGVTKRLALNLNEVSTERYPGVTWSAEQADSSRFSAIWCGLHDLNGGYLSTWQWKLEASQATIEVSILYEVLTNPGVTLHTRIFDPLDGIGITPSLDSVTLTTTAGVARTTLTITLSDVYPDRVPDGRIVWLCFQPISAVASTPGVDDVTITRTGTTTEEYSPYHWEVTTGSGSYNPSLWTITDVAGVGGKTTTYATAPFFREGPHSVPLNDDTYYWFHPTITAYSWGTTGAAVITRCGEMTLHSINAYATGTSVSQRGTGSNVTALRLALAGGKDPSGIQHGAIGLRREYVMASRPPVYAWGPWQKDGTTNTEEEPLISPLVRSTSYQTLAQFELAPPDDISMNATDRSWRSLLICPYWLLVAQRNSAISQTRTYQRYLTFEISNGTVSGATLTWSQVSEFSRYVTAYGSPWFDEHWQALGKTLPGTSSLAYRTNAYTRGLMIPYREIDDVVSAAMTDPFVIDGNSGSSARQYLRIRAKWSDETYNSTNTPDLLLNLGTWVEACSPEGGRWTDVTIAT